jgi:Spy/CpxP family protein refolding chaperone
MNRRIIVAVGLALLTSPIAIRAQAAEPAPAAPSGHKRADKIGLTDDQKKKMDAIKASEKGEMKAVMEKRHELSQKLADQMDKNATDADLKVTLAALSSNRDAAESIEKKYRAQRQAVLTPKQQAEMVVSRMKHREKMKKERADRNKGDEDEEHERDSDGE